MYKENLTYREFPDYTLTLVEFSFQVMLSNFYLFLDLVKGNQLHIYNVYRTLKIIFKYDSDTHYHQSGTDEGIIFPCPPT